MPAAARIADIGSGHGCFPPTPIIGGAGDVSINGRPAARKGDSLVPHGCGNCPPHGRSISGGSSTVSINGKPAARVSDGIGCGGTISSGSGDTRIGDGGMGGAVKSCMEQASKSGAAFVKVAFDAFPVPANIKNAIDFAMAVGDGPDALMAQIRRQAASLVGDALQDMQNHAFAQALESLGGASAPLSAPALAEKASGALLHDALIGQVTRAASGTLASHLVATVQPQLAQTVAGAAQSALQTGLIGPEALAGSAQPKAIPAAPEAAALVAAIGQAAISDNRSAATALIAALSSITHAAATQAVAKFIGPSAE